VNDIVPVIQAAAGAPALNNVFANSSSNTSAYTSPRPNPVQPKVSPGMTPPAAQGTTTRTAAAPGQAQPNTTPNGAGQSSWATVGNYDAATRTINIASSKPAPRKAIFLNAEQQRVDQAIAKVDEGAQRAVQMRIKSKKLCNMYHLNDSCSNGKPCEFGHEPKLEAAERNALRHKARELPCYKLSSCRDFGCTVGDKIWYGDTD